MLDELPQKNDAINLDDGLYTLDRFTATEKSVWLLPIRRVNRNYVADEERKDKLCRTNRLMRDAYMIESFGPAE